VTLLVRATSFLETWIAVIGGELANKGHALVFGPGKNRRSSTTSSSFDAVGRRSSWANLSPKRSRLRWSLIKGNLCADRLQNDPLDNCRATGFIF
jgi:hypothetical protein